LRQLAALFLSALGLAFLTACPVVVIEHPQGTVIVRNDSSFVINEISVYRPPGACSSWYSGELLDDFLNPGEVFSVVLPASPCDYSLDVRATDYHYWQYQSLVIRAGRQVTFVCTDVNVWPSE